MMTSSYEGHHWSSSMVMMMTTMMMITIILRARVGYEMIDSQQGAWRRFVYNHLISNKSEWNNCFIKKQSRNVAVSC